MPSLKYEILQNTGILLQEMMVVFITEVVSIAHIEIIHESHIDVELLEDQSFAVMCGARKTSEDQSLLITDFFAETSMQAPLRTHASYILRNLFTQMDHISQNACNTGLQLVTLLGDPHKDIRTKDSVFAYTEASQLLRSIIGIQDASLFQAFELSLVDTIANEIEAAFQSNSVDFIKRVSSTVFKTILLSRILGVPRRCLVRVLNTAIVGNEAVGFSCLKRAVAVCTISIAVSSCF